MHRDNRENHLRTLRLLREFAASFGEHLDIPEGADNLRHMLSEVGRRPQ
jgi:hypothetical protein